MSSNADNDADLVASSNFAFPLTFAAGLVVAQEDPAAMMETLDADGSGTLGEEEASGNEMIMGQWDTLDAYGNNEISAEELTSLAK